MKEWDLKRASVANSCSDITALTNNSLKIMRQSQTRNEGPKDSVLSFTGFSIIFSNEPK
jgi:hypothetical protein